MLVGVSSCLPNNLTRRLKSFLYPVVKELGEAVARARILVTNDDGIASPGIHAVAAALRGAWRGVGRGTGSRADRGWTCGDVA